MTFQFVNVDFMFEISLDDKTAAETGAMITDLKERLKAKGFCFGEIFPVLLTDNGGEFSNVLPLKTTPPGNRGLPYSTVKGSDLSIFSMYVRSDFSR